MQTDPNADGGLPLIFRFFVDKYGFKEDYVRTLLIKYPFALSKTEEHLETYFSQMRDLGLSNVSKYFD